MLDPIRPNPEERLLRALAVSYDFNLCEELVRLYLRANQPVTAWRYVHRLGQALGFDELRDLKAQIQQRARLTIISHEEYQQALNRTRGVQTHQGNTWRVRQDPVELPRGERKRACIFYFIWSLLDQGIRYSPDDLDWLINAALEELSIASDHCHIRRYMLSAHMLGRTPEGATYWANPESPVIVLSP